MSSKIITIDHGSGGKLTLDLIEMFTDYFGDSGIDSMTDSAVFSTDSGTAAFTTDSYVVNPLHFPGGDIGKLAVCGTVNDLAVSGAVPKYLSCAFILEEGLELEELETIVKSMAGTAEAADVKIVTGDTKVVERGACDKMFINTSGVGFLKDKHSSLGSGINVAEGDKILINGNIGDHGLSVLSIRNSFSNEIKSDCAPLNGLITTCLEINDCIHCMRDATRGGLAAVLTELASKIKAGINMEETNIPVAESTRGLCELLGFDPLHLANEGKVIIVAGKGWEDILKTMKNHPLGRKSRVIGTIVNDHPGRVVLETEIGGSRIIDIPAGMQLPRIC
ncbi:MAG: hydrogenase expression/formation protein HypE [Spirochaetales bacterium]|nr:hydrogenase expression/formation protein HypE [Spirochaetales bacterium]